MYPRGSEWRRWDLHIHTPLTILNNQYPRTGGGQPNWEPFLQRLEGAGLAAVGVTDYFTIEGYKALREIQGSGRLAGITLLPNIEFRLNKLVNDKRLTLHVVFSEDVAPEDIEDHFLHDLHFFYEGNPQNRDESLKLKLSNLEAMGRRLQEDHAPFRDRPPLEIGVTTAIVDDQEIADYLADSSRFRGKYLIALADESLSDINWNGQGHVARKGLLQKSDLVFTSNPKGVRWCLGERPYEGGEEAFVREFKSLKPCVHGSDAHSLREIGVPCAKRGEAGHCCGEAGHVCELRHCWIKADPTFEGLRQIVYEPSARVRIQAEDPTPLKSKYSLDGLRLDETRVNDELTITATELPLNAGLVAVAGGKGSGKTALLDLIAHSFVDRRHVENPNSFVRRIADEAPGLRSSITFRDGTSFEKTLDARSFFEQSGITYIAQGELEERVSDRVALATHIRELVLGSTQIRDTVRAFELAEAEKELEKRRARLVQLHEEIVQLEDATAGSVQEGVARDDTQLAAALQDLDLRIAAVEKKMGAERTKAAEEKQTTIRAIEERKAQLLALRDQLDALQEFVGTALPKAIRDAQQANATLKLLDINQVIPVPSYESGWLDGVRGDVDARLREALERLEAASTELASLEAGVQEHAALLRKKAELTTQLAGVRTSRERIEADKGTLKERKEERRRMFEALLAGTIDHRDRYRELLEAFGKDNPEVLADVVFTPEIEFGGDSFVESVESVIDNRQVRDVRDEVKALLDAYDRLRRGDRNEASKIAELVDELSSRFAGKLKRSRAITTSGLYGALWGSYLAVRPVVLYKGIGLARLSLGQKATVLVKVYLAQGLTPILIDSHDEHLDNEFIMQELVGALRRAKEYRQVIIASNNGNVVVNSDAEQVVVATFDGGRISYAAGALEAPDIRDRAIRILEGGADAFRRRQEKYRIS